MQKNPQVTDDIVMPAMMIPGWKTFYAKSRGVLDNILIKAWGGLGDVICAEPAIRYAKKLFPNCSISLATHHPQLFSHLEFDQVFDMNKAMPIWENYFVFDTIYPPEHLVWQFMSHMLTHPVDFSSLCMWRMQLPIAEREIQLPKHPMSAQVFSALNAKNAIPLHFGQHWASKTFPIEWCEALKEEFINAGFTPILIGKDDRNGHHGGTGYVPVKSIGCIDLRDKLDLGSFVAILQNAKWIFSNDSSPIHAAASGDAYIGFVASCKHPDFLMHWRKGQFGWRTANFGLDGAWNHIDHGPNATETIEVERLPEGLMEKILPEPSSIVAKYIEWGNMKS